MSPNMKKPQKSEVLTKQFDIKLHSAIMYPVLPEPSAFKAHFSLETFDMWQPDWSVRTQKVPSNAPAALMRAACDLKAVEQCVCGEVEQSLWMRGSLKKQPISWEYLMEESLIEKALSFYIVLQTASCDINREKTESYCEG